MGKNSVVRVISREGYKSYDEDVNGNRVADLEFYNRKCYKCGQDLWQYCVEGANPERVPETISDYGLADGYGLLCKGCYEKFINFAEDHKLSIDHYYNIKGE